MAELIFTATPQRAVTEIILKEYKGGKVALYGSAPEAERALSEAEISFVLCEGEPPEYARFFIGAGNFSALNAAKYYAAGEPIIMLPDRVQRICFNQFCANGHHILRTKEPEYIVIDKTHIKNSRSTLVAELFGALTDTVDLLSGRGAGREELVCARERILDALLCPQEDIHSIKALQEGESAMDDLLGAAALVPFTNLAIEGTEDSFLDFFTYYLINLSVLQFTKFDFNGILLGADRVRLRNAQKPCYVREVPPANPYFWRERAKKAVLSRSQLKAAANRFLGEALEVYRRWDTGKVIDNLLIAWEYTGTDGIFSALISEGFIEGLTNDETEN